MQREDGAGMATISSSAPAASARRAGSPRTRASSPRTSPCAGAVFVEQQAPVRRQRPRRARRRAPDTLHAVGVVDGAVVGAVRLYPLDATGCGRATGWRCCPRRACGTLGAQLVRFAVATAGELRRPRGWSRRCSCPTCASSSGSAGSADGDAGALPRRHAPADGDPAARPVSGVRAEVPHRRLRRRRRPGAGRAVSSKRAARRAREPAARRTPRTRRGGVLAGAPRAGSRSSGTSAASARAAAPSRARERVEVERRAAAGALDHLQQRAGDARHRDVARGVAEPGLGDLDERLAVVAQPLRRRGRAAR